MKRSMLIVTLIAACSGEQSSQQLPPVSLPAASGAVAPATSAAGSPANAMPPAISTPIAGTSGALPASGNTSTPPTPAGTAGLNSPSAAAGSNAAASAGPTAVAGTGAAMPGMSCATCPISDSCMGLPLKGMKYSPGGTTLPNKCAAFDPTLNNPYAIRCIDALPGYKTKFPGDQYCILPPPPELGMQVGLHPQGDSDAYWKAMWAGDYSGYDNPSKEWVVMPGNEITQNYMTTGKNSEAKNYYRTYFRMRTGSHHNIVSMHMASTPDGWISNGGGEALPGPFDLTSGTVIGILGGQQRPDDGTPSTLDKPPEDEGLYLTFPAAPRVLFNMHHFNPSDKAVLREGWSNIWYEANAKVLANWYMGMELSQILTLNVASGKTADLHYSWPISAEMRLLRVFGHRHFWTTNFSSWIKRAGGETELIYQSYDWFDMPTYRYDSVVKNPPLNPADRLDGATSGIVRLHAGDTMHFNCHIDFTAKRAAQDKNAPSPAKIGSLRFANEAYNGEMCIQYGNVSEGFLGRPVVDTSPLPDFATAVR